MPSNSDPLNPLSSAQVARRARRAPPNRNKSQPRPLNQCPEPREQNEVTTIAVDFGSGSFRATLREPNTKPRVLHFGKTHDDSGSLKPADKLNTMVLFEDGSFSLLGHDQPIDFSRASSGAKQSLDPDQCKPGGEGHKFVSLAKESGVSPDSVVTDLLKAVKQHINDNLCRLGLAEVEYHLQFSIPVGWTYGPNASSIQDKLNLMLTNAGFPLDRAFDTEPAAVFAFVNARLSAKDRQETEGMVKVLFDVGASTFDTTVWAEYSLLGSEPRGCDGGMANAWRSFHNECLELNASDCDTLYHALRSFIFRLHPESVDFRYGDHVIPFVRIQKILEDSYSEPRKTLEQTICETQNIREILVSGEAVASNALIRHMFKEWIQSALKDAKHPSNCTLTILDSEDASHAVAKGAAQPYPDDPLPLFWERPFGFKCQKPCIETECPGVIRCTHACKTEGCFGRGRLCKHACVEDGCPGGRTCEHACPKEQCSGGMRLCEHPCTEKECLGGRKCEHTCAAAMKCTGGDECNHKNYILEAKPAQSFYFSKAWESVVPEGHVLELELHMIARGDALEDKSDDTWHKVWPMTHAVPMRSIEMDLGKHISPGQPVWILWRWEKFPGDCDSSQPASPYEPPLIRVEVSLDKTEKWIVASRLYEVHLDRDGLFVINVDPSEAPKAIDDPLEAQEAIDIYDFPGSPPPRRRRLPEQSDGNAKKRQRK